MAEDYRVTDIEADVDDHEQRISSLEMWRQRIMGALAMLGFIIGSAGLGAFVLQYLF